MRLGVFGGTFDPVHVGHLILAEQCREQGRLDKVLFIPAPRPPHKQDRLLALFDHRLEMLILATSGQPAFQVDDMEKDRPGPSFTVDTLARLHERHGEAELFLIVGSDSLRDLPQWYEPVRILEQAGLLIALRPGSPILGRDEVIKALALADSFPLRYQVCDMPAIDIASRDLRKRLAAGRSVRYMVPRAVEAYIQDKCLYQNS
jgi:nicotinate-nucleotide adenylyltransferase